MTELKRPVGIGDDAWSAISESADRLDRAVTSEDHSLIVGSAKDLCESVARVVINERGTVAQGDDMTDLVHTAHKALEFQPAEGIASDAETRKIAQSLKTLVLALSEIRNRHGTGHGRATPSGVTADHAELACGAAELWTRWALRRLEPYIAGSITPLVRDLDSAIFSRGDLAKRLTAANLSRLGEDDQRRVGLAVGRRAARGTFVVSKDGVVAANAEDTSRWPPQYIEGVLMGLLFDANGYLALGESPAWAIRQLARLTAGASEGTDLLQTVGVRVARASEARRVTSDDVARTAAAAEAAVAMEAASTTELRQLWRHLTENLAPRN